MKKRKAARLKILKQHIAAKDVSELEPGRPAIRRRVVWRGLTATGTVPLDFSKMEKDQLESEVARTRKRGTIMTPRHLLLNIGDLRKASPDELEALRKYIKRRG